MAFKLGFLALYLGCSITVQAQTYSDYIEKQIQSGSLTREEARQLYGTTTSQAAPATKPIKSMVNTKTAVNAESQFLTLFKSELQRQGVSLSIVNSVNSVQGANEIVRIGKGMCPVITGGLSADKFIKLLSGSLQNKKQISSDLADKFSSAFYVGLTQSTYCATIPAIPTQPSSPQEMRYLTTVQQLLQREGIPDASFAIANLSSNQVLLMTGRAFCKYRSKGVPEEQVRSSMLDEGKFQEPKVLGAIIQAASTELCPS